MSLTPNRRASVLLALGAVTATSTLLTTAPAQAATTTPTTFASTGALQSYTVPSGICRLTITAQGGSGADFQRTWGTRPGGRGAVITATVPVPAGDTLSVLAGGAGNGDGGFGGGGSGGGGAAGTDFGDPGDGGLVASDGTAANGGGPYETPGLATGVGGRSSSLGDQSVGGSGGGVVKGGYGASWTSSLYAIDGQSGDGGNGDGKKVGGGGSGAASPDIVSTDGGTANDAGQMGGGGNTGRFPYAAGGAGDGRGGNGGAGGGGGGGIGFGGGGGGGGGAGWGGGAGRAGGWGAGGGSSHVIDGATGITSSLSSGGDGSVSITYDPAADTCDGTPGAPTGVTATGALGRATVSFSPPGSTGASDISSYRVTATATDGSTPPRERTTNGVTSAVTVDGLYPGSTYTFTVVAINGAGAGVASAPSDPVTMATAPGVPTGVAATTGKDGSAEVAFTPPASDGGAAITSYTVTAFDSAGDAGQGRTGAGSPLTVTGLTPGDDYTFTVAALNKAGAGEASEASNILTATAASGGSSQSFTSDAATTFTTTGSGSSFQVSTTDTGASFAAIGELPTGITLTSGGLLTGKAKRHDAGTYPFTIVAVSDDLTSTATQEFTLTVAK